MEKLAEFGFSPNQAKVYSAIACSKCTTVSQISKATNIHTQDIYKILLALEKKGLILRTLNRPIKIDAIPLKEALKLMLELEKEKSNERLKSLNSTLTEIEQIFDKAAKEAPYTMTNATIDTQDAKIFVLETQDLESARVKIEMTFDNMKTEYDLVVPVHHVHRKHDDAYLKEIAQRGLKIRVLIILGNDKDKYRFIEALKQDIPCTDNCELRTLEIEEKLHFAIIDSREAWFRLASVDENPESTSVLVTDSKGMVTLAKHEFETLWNDARTKVLLPYSRNKRHNLLAA